jgi:hypothetical protein
MKAVEYFAGDLARSQGHGNGGSVGRLESAVPHVVSINALATIRGASYARLRRAPRTNDAFAGRPGWRMQLSWQTYVFIVLKARRLRVNVIRTFLNICWVLPWEPFP